MKLGANFMEGMLIEVYIGLGAILFAAKTDGLRSIRGKK